jgi:hypothetical protein
MTGGRCGVALTKKGPDAAWLVMMSRNTACELEQTPSLPRFQPEGSVAALAAVCEQEPCRWDECHHQRGRQTGDSGLVIEDYGPRTIRTE